MPIVIGFVPCGGRAGWRGGRAGTLSRAALLGASLIATFAAISLTSDEDSDMYANKSSILQLAALLRAHGVDEVVVCPGSRNAPLVQTFAAAGFVCHGVTDERSAGFYALGLSLACGRPVVVCCTSGSALVNLHPAVTEAYYQGVPLLVVSADRPAAWIGQMDGQTLPQPGVFGRLVRMSVNLPEVRCAQDEWHCNRLVNEALLAAVHHGRGPVHINVPVGEPLFDFTATRLPAERAITRYAGCAGCDEGLRRLADRLSSAERPMVVVGQLPPGGRFAALPREGGWARAAWLAEHLSEGRLPFGCVTNADVLLYAMDEETKERLAPDLLVTFGGHVVSKRVKQFIRNHPPREHWHLAADGGVADTYCCLTSVVECDPLEAVVRVGASGGGGETTYRSEWMRRRMEVAPPHFGYSAMGAVGGLVGRLPGRCTLHLANSSAVRYAQLYALGAGVKVSCNRGVNGIEGSLSSALGYAAADPSELNFVVVGDLSFFYDMNSLGIAGGKSNVRILLLNNGGGEIFSSLNGLDGAREGFPFVTGQHALSARGWAEAAGFSYAAVHDQASLDAALDALVSPSTGAGAALVEVFTDTARDVAMLKEYYRSLKNKQ